jgi:hypothetical protein
LLHRHRQPHRRNHRSVGAYIHSMSHIIPHIVHNSSWPSLASTPPSIQDSHQSQRCIHTRCSLSSDSWAPGAQMNDHKSLHLQNSSRVFVCHKIITVAVNVRTPNALEGKVPIPWLPGLIVVFVLLRRRRRTSTFLTEIATRCDNAYS